MNKPTNKLYKTRGDKSIDKNKLIRLWAEQKLKELRESPDSQFKTWLEK